jgi:hypothetical protein
MLSTVGLLLADFPPRRAATIAVALGGFIGVTEKYRKTWYAVNAVTR